MMNPERLITDSDKQSIKFSSIFGKLFKINSAIRPKKLNMFFVKLLMIFEVNEFIFSFL